MRHDNERQRSEDRADEEVGPAPAEPGPGAVAQVSDDGLDDEPGDRRRDPEQRDVFNLGTERLEDPAHVGVLEREAELNPEEPEAHVPDVPEREPRLGPDRRGRGGHLTPWARDLATNP